MMEYWLQLVNDQSQKLLTEHEAERLQQQQRDDDQETAFISVFSHKGCPILPPLMTPHRRREMQNHRSTARAIEGYLRGKNECKSKVRHYDNGLKRIIKPSPPPPPSPSPSQPLSIPSSVLIEDPPLMAGQRAAVQLCGPLFAKASKSLVARSEPPVKPLIVGPPRRPMSKLKEQELEEARKDKERREREKLHNLRLEHRHTMDLIEMAKALPWGFFQIEPLLRSHTDPNIQRKPQCHTEFNLPGLPHSRTDSNLLRKDSNTESSLQLHPQLWKRKDPIVQSCPNSPRKYRYPSKKKQENETQEGPKGYRKEEPKRAERKQSLERKPKPKGRFSLSPRRPAPPHNVSRGGYAFDPSMNSVAQRRRSYDPKASLMRDAKEKVAGKHMPHSTRQSAPFGRSPAPFGRSPAPSNTPKETLSTVTIAQKEAEEKRQVFLELVSQQAEEQQRLQAQFEAQQQILIEQMLYEVNQLSNEAGGFTTD